MPVAISGLATLLSGVACVRCSSRSSSSTPAAWSPTRRSPAVRREPARDARPALRRRPRAGRAGRARRGLPHRRLPGRAAQRAARAADPVRQRRAGGARHRAARRPARDRRRGARRAAGRPRDHRARAGRPARRAAAHRRAHPRARLGHRARRRRRRPASLAFMPLLRPDVVKLDLRLVQERPGPEVAEIMNAVNAYAEQLRRGRARRGHRGPRRTSDGPRAGRHARPGLAVRPARPGRVRGLPAGELLLPGVARRAGRARRSPFGCLARLDAAAHGRRRRC